MAFSVACYAMCGEDHQPCDKSGFPSMLTGIGLCHLIGCFFLNSNDPAEG